MKIRNKLGRNFKKARTPDKLTKEGRSSLMSKIRSKDTRFETDFIGLLKKAVTNKFQTHVKTLKGTPDIVFAKEKLCIFLDSDFWHGWQYPRWQHLLKDDFWKNKITANRKRDLKATRLLKNSGWLVLRFWEHDIKKNPEKTIRVIEKTLKIWPKMKRIKF